MQTTIECNYPLQLPQLSAQSCDGLKELWSNSCITKTEWVGGIISTPQQPDLSIICLGQQSEGIVTSPIIDLHRRSIIAVGAFNEDFIIQEIKLASEDLKQNPDDYGCCYQGKALFLLPEQYICDAISKVADGEGDLILPLEDFLGLAHTHPFRNKLSHLPSLPDLRCFVFGQTDQALECVISNGLISMLVKTTNTPVYFNRPDCHLFFDNQRLNDAIALDHYCESLSEDQAYLSVLRDNCNNFRLQLLEGNVQENSQLSLIF